MFRLSPGHLLGEGPWSAEVIRAALRQGRLSLLARACRVEEKDGVLVDGEWKALEEHPEFRDLLQGSQTLKPPPLPPGLSGGDTSRAQSVPRQSTVHPVDAGARAGVLRPKLSGWAVASLIFGIVGFFLVTALVSVGCGLKALSQIRRGQGKWYGKGMAWLGMVLGVVTMLVTIILFVVVVRSINTGRFPGRPPRPVPVSMTCHERLLKLGEAVRGYALDHADLLPAAESWCDVVREYADSDEIFACPQPGGGVRLSFAFNAAAAGLNIEELPADMVLLYEAEGASDWNRAGGPELARDRSGGVWVYRADGQLAQMRMDELKSARWRP